MLALTGKRKDGESKQETGAGPGFASSAGQFLHVKEWILTLDTSEVHFQGHFADLLHE